MFDGTHINLLIAFLAGVSTFFASCLLPLVPVYLAYLSGLSLNELKQKNRRWLIFKSSLFFVLGFIVIFLALGSTIYSFSKLISLSRAWMDKLGGFLFIFFGLHLLGVFKISFLNQEFRFNPNNWFKNNHLLHAFIVGLTFGFAWSPCIGPVLGVILFWVSRQSTAMLGLRLLLSFSFGLATPFLLLGLAFEKIFPLIQKNKNITKNLQFISGIIILASGVFMLVGRFQQVSLFLLKLIKISPLTP